MESLLRRLLSNLSSLILILIFIYNTLPLPFYSIKDFVPSILAQSIREILLAPMTPIHASVLAILASLILTKCTIFKLAK
jgi:hypothetical protein